VHGSRPTPVSADEDLRRSVVIGEIAFQASLLALHAAVEAVDGGLSSLGIKAAAGELAGLLRHCEHDQLWHLDRRSDAADRNSRPGGREHVTGPVRVERGRVQTVVPTPSALPHAIEGGEGR